MADENSDEEWARIAEVVTAMENGQAQQSANQPMAPTHSPATPNWSHFQTTPSPAPMAPPPFASARTSHAWPPPNPSGPSAPPPNGARSSINAPSASVANGASLPRASLPSSRGPHTGRAQNFSLPRRAPHPRQASQFQHSPHVQPSPRPSSSHAQPSSHASLPPHPPSQSAGPSLSARDLETAGQLANYRGKLSALERELAQLRARAPGASSASAPSDSVDALRRQLAASRSAQRRMEERLAFAERELEARKEAGEFVEATQAPQSQTPASQAISQLPTQRPSPQRRSPARRSRGVSMSRNAPPRAKRRRVSAASHSGGLPPSSRPSSAGSAADSRDWSVPDAAWWAAYDAPDRVAERARAAIFAPPHADALLALAAGRGGAELRDALAAALGGGGEQVWAKLHCALLSAAAASGAGAARRAALSAVLDIHLNFPRGIGADAEARSAAAALRVLAEDSAEDRDLALELLAAVGGSGVRALEKRAERALREALAACSVHGAEAGAAAVRAAVLAGEDGLLAAERLCAAALNSLPHGGARFATAALALVERVAAVAPYGAQRWWALLALLDCPANSRRAARIVADVGAAEAPPPALARAVAVLRDGRGKCGGTAVQPSSGTVSIDNGTRIGPCENSEVQALTRVLAAWSAFAAKQGTT